MENKNLNKLGIDIGSTTVKIAVLGKNNELLFADYERHFANIRETLTDLLKKAFDKLGNLKLAPMITGSGGLTLAKHLGIPFVQEHFELLIVGIVAVSIIPTVVGLVKAKLGKKNA